MGTSRRLDDPPPLSPITPRQTFRHHSFRQLLFISTRQPFRPPSLLYRSSLFSSICNIRSSFHSLCGAQGSGCQCGARIRFVDHCPRFVAEAHIAVLVAASSDRIVFRNRNGQREHRKRHIRRLRPPKMTRTLTTTRRKIPSSLPCTFQKTPMLCSKRITLPRIS